MCIPAEAHPGLRERLGGRWAISVQGYLILCAGLFLTLLANEAGATNSVRGAIAWLGIGLGGCLVLGAYLLVLDRFTPYARRRERTVPLWVLMVGTAGAGVVLGVAIGLLAALVGQATSEGVLQRVAGYVIIGVWIGLGLILLLDGIDRSRRRRDALIERQVGLELAALQQTLLVDELRSQAVASVESDLAAARDDVARRLDAMDAGPPGPDDTQVAAMLRDVASGQVRALSRHLWDTAARTYPKAPWWTVLASTIRREPLRPIALLAIYVLGNVTALTGEFGTSTGLAMLGLVSLEIVVVTFVANRLMRRFPRWHAPLFIAGALMLQAYLVPMALWRDSVVAGSGSVSWALTQLVAGLALIVATSAVGSWVHVQGALERAYERDLDQARVRSIARSRAVAELARDLSRQLHGSVQSTLVACAAMSEQAVTQGDSAQLRTTLMEAHRALSASAAGLGDEPVPLGLAAEVRRKAGLWEGLCDITVRIDPALDAASAPVAAVGRVVEEAISNAIRHGGATAITVAVAPAEPAGVRLTIDDNGTGRPAGATPGLGSAVLDEATARRWSLERLPRGERMLAVVSH